MTADKNKANAQSVRLVEIESMDQMKSEHGQGHVDETLLSAFRRLFADVFSNDPSLSSRRSLIQRLSDALTENSTAIKEGYRNSTTRLLRWTREGGAFCALFVISVGSITFLALTGLIIFVLFFLAATANAIIISLLVSLAAASGFLVLFFTFMTGIYIVALSVALFLVSTATISAIIVVIVATGWVGFWWTVWLAAKKSIEITKRSLSMTGSAISAYSSSLQTSHQRHEKVAVD